ncbi:N-acetylmuramoyl-L-alanine amidase [Vitreimonas sp.]|uniref:N-acetylmuramoyl-L-alanine amidase n=1 Tax=Vitreimonas sp. TaxID=3069702 RepID=UPI002D7828A9|nr:N-acetylmuramoyl-L-alanine amidase [Vitreimonas sp.]
MSGRAWADAPSAVRGVLLQADGPAARVTIALDRQAQARTFFLSDPHRFVIDLVNTRLALPQGASGEGPGAGFVRRFRYAPQPNGGARLVLDLEAPARLLRQDVGGRRAPELTFDLTPTTPFAAAPAAGQPRRPQRRTIVVDAGHGGRDPGAIGRTGVREKDVVLDAALQLRQALESRGNYRVAMTRDADRYIPLEERLHFTRAQNADLFISIHADSNANAEAAGASVYTISERGEARAQNMAQNWDIDLGDVPREGVAHDILLNLYQRETTNRSAQFAQTVIPRLGEVAPLLRNTHRNAGLYVLLAPDVPAVLIETGFLSNVADERRLADPRARQAMAEAMAQAVDSYFAAPQLMAARA